MNTSHPSSFASFFLIEMHVWTFSCQSAILLYLLAMFFFLHFVHSTLHLLTFLLLSHWLFSPLWSKVCVAFFSSLSSVEYLVSSYPCSFSWEMAEAVFREGLEDFDRGRKYLWLFLNEFFSSFLVVISLKYLDKSSKPDIHNIQTVKMCCSTSTLQLSSIKKKSCHTHIHKNNTKALQLHTAFYLNASPLEVKAQREGKTLPRQMWHFHTFLHALFFFLSLCAQSSCLNKLSVCVCVCACRIHFHAFIFWLNTPWFLFLLFERFNSLLN